MEKERGEYLGLRKDTQTDDYLDQLKAKATERFLDDEEIHWLLKNFESLKYKVHIRNVFAISTNPKEHVPIFFYDKHLGKSLVLGDKNLRFRLQFGGARSGTIKRVDDKTALLVRFATKDPAKSVVAHMITLLSVDPNGSLVDKKDGGKHYNEIKQPVLVQVLLQDAAHPAQPKSKKRKAEALPIPPPPAKVSKEENTSSSIHPTSNTSDLGFLPFSLGDRLFSDSLDRSSDWKFAGNYSSSSGSSFSLELHPNHGPPYTEVGVKLKGRGFTPNCRVFWAGCPIQSIFISENEIWCFSPEGQPGQNAEVVVRDVSATEPCLFTFDSASAPEKPSTRRYWTDLIPKQSSLPSTPSQESMSKPESQLAGYVTQVLTQSMEPMKLGQIVKEMNKIVTEPFTKSDVSRILHAMQERGDVTKKGSTWKLTNDSQTPALDPPFVLQLPPTPTSFPQAETYTPLNSLTSLTTLSPRPFIEKQKEENIINVLAEMQETKRKET